MIKIWFLLVMMSMPNAPSIKYTGSIYPTENDCIRAGLTESYEILYADGNFTKEQINKLQLYAKYTCTPIEDEGKVTT